MIEGAPTASSKWLKRGSGTCALADSRPRCRVRRVFSSFFSPSYTTPRMTSAVSGYSSTMVPFDHVSTAADCAAGAIRSSRSTTSPSFRGRSFLVTVPSTRVALMMDASWAAAGAGPDNSREPTTATASPVPPPDRFLVPPLLVAVPVRTRTPSRPRSPARGAAGRPPGGGCRSNPARGAAHSPQRGAGLPPPGQPIHGPRDEVAQLREAAQALADREVEVQVHLPADVARLAGG